MFGENVGWERPRVDLACWFFVVNEYYHEETSLVANSEIYCAHQLVCNMTSSKVETLLRVEISRVYIRQLLSADH